MANSRKGKRLYGRSPESGTGVGAAAATVLYELPIFRASYLGQVLSCRIIPDAAVSGDGTNNHTLLFRQYDADGTLVGTIASKAYTAGIDHAALIPEDFGSVALSRLAEGDFITLQKTEGGTGNTAPDLLAIVVYIRR